MKTGVLLNGVPASGKSTVARALADEAGWPLLTLDAIKEALFNQLGAGDRAYNRRLGRASYEAIFSLIADFPAGSQVLIDVWFGFQPREFVLEHIGRAGFSAVVEVWCHAPADVIAQRYTARIGLRSSHHPGPEYVPELIDLASHAKPLGGFPLIDVDTTAHLDAASLAARVRQLLSNS